jgi:hypothetical protein
VSEPADALRDLAALLRADRSVVSPRVDDPDGEPVVGLLAAAGPRTAREASAYALVAESVREGYLLHYAPAEARVVRDGDPDLALLAGDYLYALGLERLAGLGDLESVRELSDLISLAAQVHDGSRPADRVEQEASALWLACACAIAGGSGPAHGAAKDALRAGAERAAGALWAAAGAMADAGGFGEALSVAAAGLDLRLDHLPSLG